MLIQPLDRMRRHRKPWALILGAGLTGYTVLTEAGELVTKHGADACADELRRLGRDHVIFTTNARGTLVATDARRWTVRTRRIRTVGMRLDDGPAVHRVPTGLLPDDRHAAARAWITYLDWLAGFDVWPTSRSGFGAFGRHLFAATLREPISFRAPARIARGAFYGGRKQAPFPAVYRNARQYDLGAAYPHALGTAPMPYRLRQQRGSQTSMLATIRNADAIGVAYVTATVPDTELCAWWPPLPRRRNRTLTRFLRWETGTFSGWWPLVELRRAAALGVELDPHELYVSTSEGEPFAAWYDAIQSGRQLAHGADRLAKYHANALWSAFGMGSIEVKTKRFHDAHGLRPFVVGRTEQPDFTKESAYVSAEVAARVRVRLHAEALTLPRGRPREDVVYVDTDGIIAGARKPPGTLRRPQLGRWREIREMVRVEIRSPQAYRYLCSECGDRHEAWHYKVSGVGTVDGARARFDKTPRVADDIDLSGYG